MAPRRTQLESGVTVVTEAMDGVQSVSFGLYYPTGSRHETPENNGISHFIEHLVFKGTRKRTADEINREIDLLGGASNAYTSKETICLHARVLSHHLARIVEFFADLAADAFPPTLGPEVEQEREVILAEISAVEDSPEDLVGDLCDRAYFGDHPLALPVVGSARAVGRLSLDEIRAHFRRHLGSRGLVVAAAGRVDHEELLALLQESLEAVPPGEVGHLAPPPTLEPATCLVKRDLEQVQVCMSARGVALDDPQRPVAELLSGVVGEGCSSRLFREVRDRRGIAYSISSCLSSYLDAGSFNVYFGVAPARLEEALEVVGRVLAEIRDGEIEESELEAAKLYLRGSTILAQESTSARMAFLAEKALLREESLSVTDDLAKLDAVSRASLRELAAQLLDRPLAIAVVGPVDEGQLPANGWDLPVR